MRPSRSRPFVIGVLSDTHGRLDDDVVATFEGFVDHVVHAGDIGDPEVLGRLECVAPVTAVLGNTDHGQDLPGVDWFAMRVLCGVRLAVVHAPGQLLRVPGIERAQIAVVGHTHRAAVGRSGELLVVNPGSVSRPRGPEGRTLAFIQIARDVPPTVRIANLD